MKRHLIDSGPLIALFDQDDKYHQAIKDFLKSYKGHLYTSWPVITEVLHMLDFNIDVQLDFLRWIQRGGVEVVQLSPTNLSRIIELSAKYSNVPMDFADATLIVISEMKNIDEIISIDSDFYVYRKLRDNNLKNIFNIKK
ncbi:type II toxin-antitoxin system VapC family toxin [Fuchsiella alkaliacetigena]|uniref:type II toxin-antitoxin system VapC family toxin n=1 Tax=Fuchsiella alkaliacetigena TaxID=957042 RepID=UPI00200ADA91|nr:PIN domain-containing protein [Fuchsiella alkaliacetigena]MCK8825501.1 PIN domain-containing protein [Fuchsiella alkaliacetigena]